jgi:7-cyano-7-deazaguanine reductase
VFNIWPKGGLIMPIPEGKVFDFMGTEAIRPDFLETIPYKGDKQYVRCETQEFSAVCPFSGLPDTGRLILEYVPGKACIELKSLKYYLISYRQVGIYQEEATDRIFKDFWQVLKPQWLKLTLVYLVRGGIETTTVMEKGDRPQ